MNAPDRIADTPAGHVDRNPPAAGDGASSKARTHQSADASRMDVRYSFERSGKLDTMLVAGVRAILAFASVIVIWATPQEPQRSVAVTYSALIAYAVYSGCVLWALSRSRAVAPHRVYAWLDVAFAGYLVALTEGTNSIFFFFFFFAILSAAFTRGFGEGMRITIGSAFIFVVAGLAMAPFPASAELDRTLIRPVYLLALGFLISHWGGSELELKRRLVLLREIGSAKHFRAGVDVTIDATLRRLCAFFVADSALLALAQSATRTSGMIYTASAANVRQAAVPASNETIRMFMAVPERATTWPRRRLSQRYLPIDTPSRLMQIQGSAKVVATLANLLEAKCITSAGYRQGDGTEGRLVLARQRKRFTDSDAAFLSQCADTLASVVENIALTEELVARAAEFERLSISRDLHDSTIQPYIGLRMAIEGVAREFRDRPEVAERLAHLVEMTEHGIDELRDYTTRLKSGAGDGVMFLGTAIDRQARRLSRFYGLDVDVLVDASLQVESRTADAIFRMASEGLSNVVRHTAAKRARVTIRGEGDCCVFEIANPLPDGSAPPRPFVPRSIAGRAAAMGGRIAVDAARDGHTIVRVSLPSRFRTP